MGRFAIRVLLGIGMMMTMRCSLAGAQEPSRASAVVAGANDEAASETKVFKRVYSGWNGTFHLIADGGTAHYYMRHHCPGECCEEDYCVSRPHLVALHCWYVGKNFFYYKAHHGDPAHRYWALEKWPTDCGRCSVWFWSETEREWCFFGWFRLEIPH
jgi:hypothetical protein